MKLEDVEKLATPQPLAPYDGSGFAGIKDCTGVCIAIMQDGKPELRDGRPTAALLAHAYSLLRPLVDALTKVLREGTERDVDTGIGPCRVFTDAYNEAEDVLAKAQEVPGI